MERKNNEIHNGKQGLTVSSALSRICRAALSSTTYYHEDLSDEFDMMRERYNLTNDESIVVAILYTKRQATKETLHKAIADSSCGDLVNCFLLESLTKKRIISVSSNGENKPMYQLTPHARDAFMKGQEFEVQPITDCMQSLQELHNHPLASLFKGQWLKAFTAGFKLAGNQVFLQVHKQFGLASFPKESQIAFWILANYFYHHFSEVYGKGDDTPDLAEGFIVPLVRKGLVDVITSNEGEQGTWYVLSAKAAGALFHGMDEIIKYDQLARFARIEPYSDITTVNLYFSSQVTHEIDALRYVISKKGFERAEQILQRNKRNPAIQSLIWGPPGTGKTEVVRQLAKESERDLISIDISKTTHSGWGDSEKAYRDFFRSYRYVAYISQNVPILLLNEADSLLSKRMGTIERSIDKAENAVTDILLQEFETMHGILIATTNFTYSIDDAFDRRFLFKTELGQPDEMAREHIWKSNIPELSDEEARELARAFTLTGAEIQNVATKRGLAELYYMGEMGISFIKELCEKELTLQKKNGIGKKIGF